MKKIVLVLALMMVMSTGLFAGPASAAEDDPPAPSATSAAEPAPDESQDPPAAVADETTEPAESPAPVDPAPQPEPAPAAADADDGGEAPAPDESSRSARAPSSDAPAAEKVDERSAERTDAPAVPDTAPAAAAADSDASSVSAAAAPAKVFVCKYVGKPGVDERLKAGKNPISVSSSSTGGAAVGNYFADGQDRSYVIAIDTGQPTPSTRACPTAAAPTTVTPVAPIVSAPTCTAGGALTLPTTPGVVYTISPVYTGAPVTYVVTAGAAPGYVIAQGAPTSFTVTVDPQLTGPGCVVPPNDPKVWVCKYVGTPGIDEVLKSGKNPIEVSVSSLPGAVGTPAIGQSFSDAQERSFVVAISPVAVEPTAADCQAPVVPDTDVTAQPPTVDPATCAADGVLRMPTTAGITYTQSPVGSGPGSYTVSATADPGFRLVGTASFPVVVDVRVTGAPCATSVTPPGGGGGSNDPGEGSGGGGGGSDDPGGGSVDLPEESTPRDGTDTPAISTTPLGAAFLPATGGTPLWYLLLGGLLTVGGLLALRWGRPGESVVHAGR